MPQRARNGTVNHVVKRRTKRQYVILPRSRDHGGTPRVRSARALDDVALEIYSKTRRELIAEAAYHRARRRGFCCGSAVDDWLTAEFEIDTMLRNAERSQT
jgi:hypothetical protein